MIPPDLPPMGFDKNHLFRMSLRVYYEDTDAAGVVYHCAYLKYAERARTEFVRALGLHQHTLMTAQGIAFAVRSCSAQFQKPAVLDDVLCVETRLVTVQGASLHFKQVINRGAETLFDFLVRIACISREGRAVRLPSDVRQPLLDSVCLSAEKAGLSRGPVCSSSRHEGPGLTIPGM